MVFGFILIKENISLYMVLFIPNLIFKRYIGGDK